MTFSFNHCFTIAFLGKFTNFTRIAVDVGGVVSNQVLKFFTGAFYNFIVNFSCCIAENFSTRARINDCAVFAPFESINKEAFHLHQYFTIAFSYYLTNFTIQAFFEYWLVKDQPFVNSVAEAFIQGAIDSNFNPTE